MSVQQCLAVSAYVRKQEKPAAYFVSQSYLRRKEKKNKRFHECSFYHPVFTRNYYKYKRHISYKLRPRESTEDICIWDE